MFTRDIKYINFKNVERVEKLCFNLTVPEVMELGFQIDDSFREYIEQAVAEGSNKKLFHMFQLLVGKAYGRFASDGETFIKKPDFLFEFLPSKQYEELFLWLFSAEKNAVAFYNNVLPKDLPERLAKLRGNAPVVDKPSLQNMSIPELEAMVSRMKAENGIAVES